MGFIAIHFKTKPPPHNTTTNLSEWRKSKTEASSNTGKDGSNMYSHFGRQFLTKLNLVFSYDAAVTLLDIHSNE